MTKAIITTLALAFMLVGASLQASSADTWRIYKAASAEAKDSLKVLENSVSVTASSAITITAQYKATAEIANSLDRSDLAAWAYNNAAYANIVLFKKLVEFDATVAKIKTLDPKSAERIALVKALYERYGANKALMDEAYALLNDAVRATQNSKKSTDEVDARILSNRDFVTYVNGILLDKEEAK